MTDIEQVHLHSGGSLGGGRGVSGSVFPGGEGSERGGGGRLVG